MAPINIVNIIKTIDIIKVDNLPLIFEKEISKFIGADKLFYQNLDDLISSVKGDNSSIQKFDASCFDGQYVTEDVTQDYLKELDNVRNDASKQNQPIDISEDVIVY